MTRDDVIKQASSYIKSTPYPNPNDITKWFWGNNLSHAWCGAFVDYVIKHDLGSNMLDSCTKDKYTGGFGYVPSIVKWAKDKGYWCDDYTKAKKGDLVIFNWTPSQKSYSHVGIVESFSVNTLTSIDGNTNLPPEYENNCVAKKVRNKKYVVGVVLLPYEEEDMFNIGDYVWALEDIPLYTTSEYKQNEYTLKKGQEAYVRYKKGDTNLALAQPEEPHNYWKSAWTNQLDKLTKNDPTDYKTKYEEEVAKNEKLTALNNELQSKINKAISDLQ